MFNFLGGHLDCRLCSAWRDGWNNAAAEARSQGRLKFAKIFAKILCGPGSPQYAQLDWYYKILKHLLRIIGKYNWFAHKKNRACTSSRFVICQLWSWIKTNLVQKRVTCPIARMKHGGRNVYCLCFNLCNLYSKSDKLRNRGIMKLSRCFEMTINNVFKTGF